MNTRALPERIHALLIEDSADQARLIQAFLTEGRAGPFNVECVERLSSGLDLFARGGFDVVLLDLNLPDSHGLETFTRMHAHAAQVPIVILSGIDEEEVALAAIRAGAQDYLVKEHMTRHTLVRAVLYAIERRYVERALRENEERFRLIMEHANDAIFFLGLNGVVQWASRGATVLTGRTLSELLGRPITAILAPASAAIAEARLAAVRRGESVPPIVETEILRPGGGSVWMELNATSVADAQRPVGRLIVARDITERKRAEAALRESEQRLNQLLDDRERISRDLHDNIIQMLYAIGLGLEESQRLIGEDSKAAAQSVSHAIKDLNAVIRDVRSYIAWSGPKISDGRQLKAAIERLARTMDGTQLLHFRLKVDQAAADKLTPEEAGHVLYIAWEAMSNSLRHSQARDGTVVLEARDGNICLVVADVGEGFDATNTERYGQGLRNMAARAKKLDARLQIISEPGLGVRIMLDIPMVRKRAPAGV